MAAALAQLAAGDAAGARVTFEKVVAQQPENARAWSGLASVCLGPRLKDYDCALAALAKVLALKPSDPQALFSTGVAHAAKGDIEKAFTSLALARATRRIDMTQLSANPLTESIRKDPRYASLLPVAADFENPFVEPTKMISEFRGENAGDGFGWIARSIGDVDGDGAEDFTTSAPQFAGAGANSGRIYVFSSRSGKRLWSADGAAGEWLGVGIEAAGDVNADGAGDVIASSPGTYAKVFNGKTGAVLLTLKAVAANEAFGQHVSTLGDVNGDRVPDVIVGAPGGPTATADFTGRAYVFSGKDGALLYTFKGERGGDRFGSAVSGATVAGKTTIVIGAPGAGPRSTGRAYVYSSLTDKPTLTADSDETGRAFAAMFVGVPGDLDGDGVQDVYVSDWQNAASGAGTGRAYVYSGKSGKPLHTFTGENAGDGLGSTQATAGDVDGDGTPDLIIGAWQYAGAAVSGGRAYLRSGKTGQLLKSFTDRIPGDTFTFDGVGIGDVDGDGTVDLLITGGGSAVNGFRSGRIFIISSGIKKDPRDPQAMLDLGVSNATQGYTELAFEWLLKARATRRVDMTQLDGNTALDPLRKDPRFAALTPTAAEFKDPFVEPTTILKEWTGEAGNDQFGWIARSIGDVDGDHAPDFVTSAPGHTTGGAHAGRIYVYSSKTGTLLWKADGAKNDQLGVGIEAAGDVNGDGAGDVIAAAPRGGYARIYDGRTGTVLFTVKGDHVYEMFGRHVAGLGDVNGDHVPDVIVGAPGGPSAPADFAGRAYIFSGKDGSQLFTLNGARAGDQFGAAVSGSSVNGRIFIVVGAPLAGDAHVGRTYVYTALTHTPAFTIEADATGNALGGMFVAIPGDMDRDGTEDVYASDWSNEAKGVSTGRIYVHSGKTGRQILTLTGETAGEGFGTSQSTAGDVDGDGTPDLIVGSWQYSGAAVGGGRAYLYSGKTGRLLKTFTCRTPGDTFGFDAVGMGDIDGDGMVDLLITSGWSAVKGFHSGRVFLISSGVRSGNQLREAYEARDYFALRDLLLKAPGARDAETEFFRAAVDTAFNRLDTSNRRIAQLLRTDVPAPLRDDLVVLKRRNDLRLFKYADAAAGARAIAASATAPAAERESARNEGRLFDAVSDVPRQESRRTSDTRLSLIRNAMGGRCAPVRIGNHERCYILDTGANLSVLMRSEALALGLTIRPAGVNVGTATDTNVIADMTVAVAMTIGEIRYRHVVFLVMPDEALSFPDGSRIPGVLGFPVIEAMGEVWFQSDDVLFVPRNPPVRAAETMALHQLMPLTRVGYGADSLLCRVDTGASVTSFYQPFYKKYAEAIERVGTRITSRVGGVGGIREIPAFRLPATTIGVVNHDVRLSEPEVYTTSIAGDATENFLDCNLGLDAMRDSGSYGFNFRSMSLLVGEAR